MQPLAENLWVIRFPLRLLGTQIGRTVTVVRLRSGELVIHSTGPFTPRDLDAICKLGQPKWLMDATLFHDAFSKAGRAMFPSSVYLAPNGFQAPCEPLTPPPQAWAGELDVLELQGMPSVREYVFFHRPSRTLIVADLVFNFGATATPWTHFVFRWGAGIRQYPAMGRLFRMSIRDRKAFNESVRQMMDWDFDRLVMAHGDVIESGAKAKLATALGGHVR
jgi:hypothetical protein